jgi:hypothetical protein
MVSISPLANRAGGSNGPGIGASTNSSIGKLIFRNGLYLAFGESSAGIGAGYGDL